MAEKIVSKVGGSSQNSNSATLLGYFAGEGVVSLSNNLNNYKEIVIQCDFIMSAPINIKVWKQMPPNLSVQNYLQIYGGGYILGNINQWYTFEIDASIENDSQIRIHYIRASNVSGTYNIYGIK